MIKCYIWDVPLQQVAIQCLVVLLGFCLPFLHFPLYQLQWAWPAWGKVWRDRTGLHGRNVWPSSRQIPASLVNNLLETNGYFALLSWAFSSHCVPKGFFHLFHSCTFVKPHMSPKGDTQSISGHYKQIEKLVAISGERRIPGGSFPRVIGKAQLEGSDCSSLTLWFTS